MCVAIFHFFLVVPYGHSKVVTNVERMTFEKQVLQIFFLLRLGNSTHFEYLFDIYILTSFIPSNCFFTRLQNTSCTIHMNRFFAIWQITITCTCLSSYMMDPQMKKHFFCRFIFCVKLSLVLYIYVIAGITMVIYWLFF